MGEKWVKLLEIPVEKTVEGGTDVVLGAFPHQTHVAFRALKDDFDEIYFPFFRKKKFRKYPFRGQILNLLSSGN